MRGRSVAAGAALFLLAACAGRPLLPDRLVELRTVELAAVPFHAQVEYQCGPAALAMLLGASGSNVGPEALVPQVFIPGRRGSLQAELVAAVRRHGRVPIVLRPELQALEAELRAGRPVLVLQNLGLGFWPQWHYAVVIGLDPARDEVLLHSGVTAGLRMKAGRFLRSWALADRWALTAVDPRIVLESATEEVWLQAAASLEQAGQLQTALQAAQAAASRWPQSPRTWFVLGNARYTQGDLRGAVAAFRESLRLEEQPATSNNLASVLGELGCLDEARDLVRRSLSQAPEAQWQLVLRETAAELEAKPATAVCGL